MMINRETKRYSIDSISLFGLLLVTLLAAFLVTTRSYRILVDDPLKLDFAGIQASLPQGLGWEGKTKDWYYSDAKSLFYLSAYYAEGKSNTVAVQWRYLIERQRLTAVDYLREKVSKQSSTIRDDGVLKLKNIDFYWANFYIVPKQMDIFLGVAALPDGRMIELELRSMDANISAKELFTAVVPTLKYKPNSLVANGKKLIDQVKPLNMPELKRRPTEDYFIVKNNGSNVGLSAGVTSLSSINGGDTLSVTKFSYLSNDGKWISRNHKFDGAFDLSQFVWQYKDERSNSSADRIVVITKKTPAQIEIIDAVKGQEKTFNLSAIAFPEILQDILLKEFIKNDIGECVVDFILPGGYVVPAVLKKCYSQGKLDCVDVFYQHAPGVGERVYVDNTGKVTRRLSHTDDSFIALRSTKAELIRYFKDFSDYINQLTR